MALVHEFALVKDVVGLDEILKSDEIVNISDNIVLYIADSLEWLTSKWNNKNEKRGLNYYGYSVICEKNIGILKNIITCWIQLFQNATDEIFLTGNYCIDEESYEKINVSKNDLLKQLHLLEELCLKAIKLGRNVVHLGI